MSKIYPSLSDDIMTVVEVATELRCSKAHVYAVIRGQVVGVSKLPAIFLGRRRLVRRTTLEQWKKDNESCPMNGTIHSKTKTGA